MKHPSPVVLFLDQFGDIGGGQRILLDLLAATIARGWRAIVLCPAGPLADAARSRGAAVHVLSLRPMRNGSKSLWSLLLAIFASHSAARTYLALAQECDLIVVNGPRTLPVARMWVRRLRKPVLLYVHGVYGRLETMFIRSFLALPRTAAVAPSALVAAPFSHQKNIHVIANWVSQEFLDAPVSPVCVRQALSIADAYPVVLIPGRFSPNKGQRLVLEASRLLSAIPCHFVFAGAPLFEAQGRGVAAELEEQARRCPDRIHVMHWQKAMPALYDGADIVVVPSIWEEPFGLTAVEAMARRRPLIVTNRGMLPVLADHGRVAQVISPDAAAIADALRAFFQSPRAWEERGGAARERVEQAYHPLHQIDAVFRIFETLLA